MQIPHIAMLDLLVDADDDGNSGTEAQERTDKESADEGRRKVLRACKTLEN